VYGRLATCYTFGPEKLRNPKRALEHAETAIQKRDANASFHTLHGACLYRLGRHREAIAVLERIYESTSTTKEGPTAMNRFFAAMTYQSLGDPAKAKECYALALNLPQPTGHPGMIPAWVEFMRAEAEAVLKIPTRK
jgi:tetratricopeptide (TPR) repeat protein